MYPLMHHVSCSVFGEMSNHPGGSASLQPRFGILQHLAFPKTNTTFERDVIFRPLMKFRKIQWDGWWRWGNCARSQGAYFEADWGIIVLCTMFLVSCIFFNKCLYFHITWLDTFWTDLVYNFFARTWFILNLVSNDTCQMGLMTKNFVNLPFYPSCTLIPSVYTHYHLFE